MIGQTMFAEDRRGLRQVYRTERDPVTGEVIIIPEDQAYVPNERSSYGGGQQQSPTSMYNSYQNMMKMMQTQPTSVEASAYSADSSAKVGGYSGDMYATTPGYYQELAPAESLMPQYTAAPIETMTPQYMSQPVETVLPQYTAQPALAAPQYVTPSGGAYGEIGSAADIGSSAAGSVGGWGNGSWLGSLFGGGESAGASGTLSTSMAPYAALGAALYGFLKNDEWMSKGSGKTFGGEMEDAWSESFGSNGLWGLIKDLF